MTQGRSPIAAPVARMPSAGIVVTEVAEAIASNGMDVDIAGIGDADVEVAAEEAAVAATAGGRIARVEAGARRERQRRHRGDSRAAASDRRSR